MPTINALTAPQVADLVTTTLKELGEMRFTDISSNLQDHTAMRNLLRRNRVSFESGYGIQWDVMINQSGAAANVGLGASDIVNIPDLGTQATLDWRNSVSSYALIGQTIAMNRTPRRIVDYVKWQRFGCLISLAELMERNFWGPPVASTDNLTPFGVNTLLVKNATQGFNGGAPSGYTTILGINPSTVPNWSNWTDQYVSVSRDDLIRRMRQAATKVRFKPTVDGIPTFDTGEENGYYTNYSVIGALEEAGESQNDNLGNDLASMDGKIMFRRVGVMYVPLLDADTTNPIYGINWGLFKTFVLAGWWLRETSVPVVPGQHTISAQFVDLTYQFGLRDRRRHWVIATGTTYPS